MCTRSNARTKSNLSNENNVWIDFWLVFLPLVVLFRWRGLAKRATPFLFPTFIVAKRHERGPNFRKSEIGVKIKTFAAASQRQGGKKKVGDGMGCQHKQTNGKRSLSWVCPPPPGFQFFDFLLRYSVVCSRCILTVEDPSDKSLLSAACLGTALNSNSEDCRRILEPAIGSIKGASGIFSRPGDSWGLLVIDRVVDSYRVAFQSVVILIVCSHRIFYREGEHLVRNMSWGWCQSAQLWATVGGECEWGGISLLGLNPPGIRRMTWRAGKSFRDLRRL